MAWKVKEDEFEEETIIPDCVKLFGVWIGCICFLILAAHVVNCLTRAV